MGVFVLGILIVNLYIWNIISNNSFNPWVYRYTWGFLLESIRCQFRDNRLLNSSKNLDEFSVFLETLNYASVYAKLERYITHRLKECMLAKAGSVEQ